MTTQNKQEINHGYCNVCGIETQPVMKCQCDFRNKPQDLKEQLIEEFDERKLRQFRMDRGQCLTCGANEQHYKHDNSYTHQYEAPNSKDYLTDGEWLRTAFARLEDSITNKRHD